MAARAAISVLVVDDSALVRTALRTTFGEGPGFQVVGEAASGRAAVELAARLRPQLITMDLDMPDGNGLEAIEEIMAVAPTRILVVTGQPRFLGTDASFEALARGALDLLPKPTAWPGTDAERQRLRQLAERLGDVPVVHHVKALRDRRRRLTLPPSPAAIAAGPLGLIALGASVGGPRTLAAIVKALPASYPVPLIAVQHLADSFAPSFIDWLAGQTHLRVVEARPGVALAAGTLYLGLRSPHVIVSERGTIELSREPPFQGNCPAIDVLFGSVAASFGPRALGILLTGMGRDGAAGLLAMRKAGSRTVAQDQETAVVYGMPRAAAELGAADRVLSLSAIIAALREEGRRA